MPYSIKILCDQTPENPRTARDCIPPLFTSGGRNYGINSYAGFDFMKFVAAKLNTKNVYKVLEILDVPKDDAKKEMRAYEYSSIELCIETINNNTLDVSDMESILKTLGYITYSRGSRGHSQGDWLDCLLVATPEFEKRIGAKRSAKDLQDSSELRDAYARGDVYGFSLVENKPLYCADGTLSDKVKEVEIDSCYGFYGDDGLDSIREEVKDKITLEQFDNAKENIVY